jgi:F0F1-type ATP synthase epsilon subunit
MADDKDVKPDETSPAEDKKVEKDASAKGSSKAAAVMHVRVASPFKTFFDSNALSLSGENATGPFDILPRHHNFISLLNECELAIKTHTGVTKVRISGGIMHVKADQVIVFLNV